MLAKFRQIRLVHLLLAALLVLAVACGGKASQKLVGKWTVDLEKMAEMDEIKKMPEDQRKAALEMAKGMMASMTFEFTADKLSIDMMGQKKEGTYKVKSEEGDKVIIEGTMDGKTETLEATFKGDGMVLGKDKQTFPLKRK